jgi:lipopolysaccharide transport system ATP-binding protein
VQSGETVTIRVRLEFLEAVENPVVGILIRSRIGVNVYGTNTEMEKAPFGPCAAGDRVELLFTLDCHLCAEQYTLTVASHDPDGTAHEWLEEAIVFTVADTRYTAGVANLRARVEVRR